MESLVVMACITGSVISLAFMSDRLRVITIGITVLVSVIVGIMSVDLMFVLTISSMLMMVSCLYGVINEISNGASKEIKIILGSK
mgnify:FL=1|jgi:hypothetical protein